LIFYLLYNFNLTHYYIARLLYHNRANDYYKFDKLMYAG